MSEANFNPFRVKKGEKKFGYMSVINTAAIMVDMPVGVICGYSDGSIFTVTAGLYGTEYDGIEAAARLYQSIDPKDLSGTLIIVPIVDMPSFQFRTPWSIGITDGLSIVRVFPGDPNGTVTQRIAYKLFNDIILKSNYHVDFRGGDLNESHLAHTIFEKTGNEIDKTCEEMAKIFGLEYVLPAKPEIGPPGHCGEGTLIHEAVVRGVPSIISESGLGYMSQPLEKYVNLHVEGVKNLLKYFGMMKGLIIKPKNQRFLDMTWQRIKAPVFGVFHAIVDQGNLVKKGEVIGKITDIDGSEIFKVVSPIDGVVHCMFPRRVVHPGDVLYTLLQVNKPTGW